MARGWRCQTIRFLFIGEQKKKKTNKKNWNANAIRAAAPTERRQQVGGDVITVAGRPVPAS